LRKIYRHLARQIAGVVAAPGDRSGGAQKYLGSMSQ
jgi:hypothetical protein